MEEKIDYKEIVNKIKPELEKVIIFFDKELQKIKTSRASPSLVEDVEVECFNQKFPLRQLATISVPEPRQIVIQPWDQSYIEYIVRALENTGVGSSPVVDKNLIRINLPALTEEFREELVHFVSEKQEEARKTIRKWREEVWREIQEKFREGKIREDDKFKGKDELQELVDDYNEKIEEMGDKKKKEIIE